jgi:hypothetical protein
MPELNFDLSHPQFTEPEAALRAAGHDVDRVILPFPFTLDPALRYGPVGHRGGTRGPGMAGVAAETAVRSRTGEASHGHAKDVFD